jgi:hypothetical protein
VYLFMFLCMLFGGSFLLRKGIREKRVSLIIIGLIFISIVLTVAYIIYRVTKGPFAFG